MHLFHTILQNASVSRCIETISSVFLLLNIHLLPDIAMQDFGEEGLSFDQLKLMFSINKIPPTQLRIRLKQVAEFNRKAKESEEGM